jgi:uncharacterized membrane protein
MPRFHKEIDIKAPVHKVYSFIEDPKNAPEVMTNMIEVNEVKGSGLGTQFKWTWKMAGMKMKGESKNIEDIPDKRIVVKTSGGIESTWTYNFKPQGEATILDLDIDYTIPVPVLGKLAEKVLLKRNERDAEANLLNLKEKLES